MKKRIGSLLLILALCFTLLPTAALASDGAWDGSIATAFAGGTGTERDPYQIAGGAQLAYLASEVNKGQTYENSHFVLTADIDLANHDWTPIGNSFSDALFGGTDYHLFAGNLDGKGHTIFNISIGTENAPLESDVFGLFGATGGKISNLNLDDITIYGTAKNVSGYIIGLAGALAGSASGPIENCHVANLSMTMNTPDSGTAAAYWIGGLVGALDGSQHIEECSAAGTIKELSGKGSIGGLIGELGRAAKITYSHADVALDVKPDYHGGAIMQIQTHSPEETEAVGRKLAVQLQPGDVLAYYGDLGAGKAAFTRGLAAGLGVTEPVTSPTYTIVNEYLSGRLPLFHFDMYRLGSADELFDIGWEDYLARGGICAVEWSEGVLF